MNTADEVQYRTAKGHCQAMSLGTFVVVVCLIAILHFTFWAIKNPLAVAHSVEEKLPSVLYNRFADSSSNDSQISEARIRADLTAISAQAKAVRTYASTLVPQVAAELGLKVSLGIWIGNLQHGARRF
jgi:exo-beta-1,3-glucanase (GH17 family)